MSPWPKGARGALALVVLLGLAGRGRAEPWSLDRALDLAPHSLSVEHRIRYEWLDDTFRPGFEDDRDDALVLRTLVHGRLALADWLRLGAELEDARAVAGEDEGVLDTTIVNAVEWLQAYAELRLDDVAGGALEVRAGRITVDLGSRRLLARNRYRNTINGFTGIDATWSRGGDLALRGLWLLPVDRRPTSPDALRDAEVELDEEDVEVQLWGLDLTARLPWKDTLELSVLGLHERDAHDRPTADRRLFTPALRLQRAPEPGRIDYQLESMVQLGESRESTTGTRDLAHFAHAHHAEVGYTLAAPWSPRIVLQYDYASGDDDPGDGNNERFDPLFGARRFDFGPTGIYGPFARSNLSSPGVRVQAKPWTGVTASAAFRGFWLASDRDAWVPVGLRDPTGDTDRRLGSQLELAVAWEPLPGNVRLEAGFAHLFSGPFAERAPGSPANGDADYLYTELAVSF
jgi:hypothetical protein